MPFYVRDDTGEVAEFHDAELALAHASRPGTRCIYARYLSKVGGVEVSGWFTREFTNGKRGPGSLSASPPSWLRTIDDAEHDGLPTGELRSR